MAVSVLFALGLLDGEEGERGGGRGGGGEERGRGSYDEVIENLLSVLGGGVSRHRLSEMRSAVLNLNRRYHCQLTSKVFYL